MKNRILQPFLLLGMLLSVMVYCIVLLIIWPVFFLGGLIWKENIFWDMMNFYSDNIPDLPEFDNNNNLKF